MTAPGTFGESDTRRPYVITPVVPGHEFSGYVEAIDPAVAEQQGIQEGDLVVVEQIVPWLAVPLLHARQVLDVPG